MEMPVWVKRISPLAGRIGEYRRDQFLGDLIAGIIVAIMLIPQAMAYAMLAGLPPQVGLYASIVPLVLYGLFGSSNTLAVDPVAMVSLLVLSGVSELAEPGTSEYIGLCLTLALLVGVVTTVVWMMWKMSRPHVAEVGRVGATEHFRNVNRYEVHTTPGLFAFRVDESLNFANAPFLDSYIMEQIADRPTICNVLLISSGINDVDATGLEVLETVRRELELIGVGFYMSDVKGPVTDRMQRAGFDNAFLNEHIFMSADTAMGHLLSTEAPPPDKRSET